MASYKTVLGRYLVVDPETGQTGKRGQFGNGTVPIASVKAKEYGHYPFHYTILHCVATPITVADDAGQAQYGGVKVYDFPEGLILTQGAIVSGVMGVTSGTIIATFAGVVALGSAVAAATGAPTLVTTAAKFMESNAIAAATSSIATIDAVTVATQLTESPGRSYDGTGGAADLFLNVKVADDASHTAAELYFTGTIKLAWLNMGDN